MNLRSQVRSGARFLLRPVWLVVWRRMEARIRAMGPLAAQPDEAWRQHMPAFLNAVSTVGAFGHELAQHRKESQARLAAFEASLAELSRQLEALLPLREQLNEVREQLNEVREQLAAAPPPDPAAARQAALQQEVANNAARIEFVRREILYEMQYGGPRALPTAATPTSTPTSFEPRILSEQKLTAARQDGLRVNLGCGHIPLDGYINVDMRALPGVDIVAEAGHLPLEPGTLRELRSAHLLEHFPLEELRRRLLPYWHSLLAPGGTFNAVVPDGEAMVAHLAGGDYPFEHFREVLFGAQDYAGDFHFNLFEPRSLQTLLEEAGFANAEVPVRGRRNGMCYEFEINARRP